MQPADARTDAQRAQASAVTRRDVSAADAMERARLKQEAQAVPAHAPPPRPDAQAEDKKLIMNRAKKPEVFTAVVPAKPGDKAVKKKKRPSNAKKAKARKPD